MRDIYIQFLKSRFSYHRRLCDGAKTVDENVAGHIDGWT